MRKVTLLTATLAVTAVASITSMSSAAVIVFTNEFVWNAYTAASDLSLVDENFAAYDGFYPTGVSGTIDGVMWSANAVGGIYCSGGMLSTNNPAAMVLDVSGSGVQGIAGNVFGTDVAFNVVPSIVTMHLADGTSYMGFIDSSSSFIGFYSTTSSITSLTIVAQPFAGSDSVYATVDNLTFAVVPAPSALALLGLAGAAMGRRRR